MAGKGSAIVAGLLVFTLLLAGCPGSGDMSLLSPFQQDWINLAIVAVFLMYMVVALLYMVANGFNMPGLLAWCKNELFQITATVMMLFMLVFALTGVDAATRGMVGQDALDAYQVQPNDYALMKVAQGYMLCQSQLIWSSYNYLIVTTAPLAIVYSSTLHVRPLKMGFSIQPGKFIQPIMDNINIAVSIMQSGAWASKAIYLILAFAQDVMFAVFLPLGVILRSIPFTRGVGGALIAIAIAFYVALPAAVLINAVVYKEHYGGLCVPNSADVIPARLKALGGGTWHYAIDSFAQAGGGVATGTFGKMGGALYLMFAVFLGGTLLSGALWLGAGLLVGVLISAMLAWAREIVFMVVILTFVGGVVQYMITFTFARELSKILGSDVDLTALLKIL
ncbi:MAG: hypothetical protein WC759_00215 [Candidatus Micrarchaeia archaeon]|jgi:hypothetical protein